MIYRGLKILVKLTLFFFFKRRIVNNAEAIPEKGPTILVANHPVTFLDPLLVAVCTKRSVHFLAKGIMFKNRWVRKIFKAFKMIPIYRAQDGVGDMSKNEDTFNHCYEHLEKGGLILIFPEGISITSRTLNPLKTGVARIALGAEERNDFKLGVKIVPVGLTYEAPHQFRKDVLINVGEGIDIQRFEKSFEADPKNTVHQVMAEIQQSLEDLTLQVSDPELTPMVDFLVAENAHRDLSFDESVKQIKQTLKAFSDDGGKDEVLLIAKKTLEIQRKKKAIGFENISLNEERGLISSTLVSLLTVILGIPVFLYGFVHNALPYYLSPRIARWISKEYEYQGPITMTAGMIICLIIYPLFFWGMFQLTNSWFYASVYLISLPILGIITYGFYRQLSGVTVQWKLLFLFHKRREEVATLVMSQKELLQQIKEASTH